MKKLKRRKRNRSNNDLFNPYENGISTYDVAYLSSKKINRNKIKLLDDQTNKEYFAA